MGIIQNQEIIKQTQALQNQMLDNIYIKTLHFIEKIIFDL